MSATIYWRPVSKKERYFKNVGAPSSFMSTLDRAFGRRAGKFTCMDLERLRGIAATYEGEENPWEEMIEAIEEFSEIEIWPEY